MPHYTLTHPSASATRNIMEHAVTRHGKIRIDSYEPGRLHVQAEKDIIESFKKTYTGWDVTEEVKIDQHDFSPASEQDLASQRAARRREWRSHGLG